MNDNICVHIMRIFSEIALKSRVNIGSGNGLLSSGTKPLPEPMLTQIHVAIWHHKARMTRQIENQLLTLEPIINAPHVIKSVKS